MPSPMAVRMACAVNPPMPGMPASRRITGSALATAMISASIAALGGAQRVDLLQHQEVKSTDSSIAGIRSSGPAATNC